MEPNLNSKILKNHRSGFQFCLSAFLIATNAFIGLLVISFLEYNLFLLLGVLFGYPVLYLQYVCSYALLIRSNYLGRNDIIKRDLLLSLCPFIRFVKTHLFAANLLSIFTSTIFCFYIISAIYLIEFDLMNGSNMGILMCYSITISFLISQPCYREILWWLILKITCSSKIVIAPNQDQRAQVDNQNEQLPVEDNQNRAQMRELNSFFGTLYAVNVYRNLYPPFNDLEPIGEISRRNDSNSISNSSKNEEYYKVVDFKTISTQECIICFDSFGPEKECVELKCNPLHVFHKDCIYEWTKHNTNCPICRKRLIRRRLGASDSDSDLSIPRLMIIHQMPRLHQGDEDVSSEDDDLGRDDLLFNRIFNRRFSPRIHHLDPINDFDRDQNRLQNEVQEVRNRLNDIVSRLQEIQEEVRQRPHIADFIYNHSNRDESPLDSSFSENSARNPSILEVISEESKENNNERQSQSFRSVISPNIPELMQDDY